MKTTPTAIESLDVSSIKEALGQLKAQLSKIHHDVNNPVTVVSGNIELIRELAKALGVESEFDGPLNDMQVALDDLTERIDKLMIVRKIVTNLSDKL
ncbi:MAG: hypothetical protein O3B41_00815 [Bacteroidetes bacterium]|nr:hypothetical protein [Bacteroidota bacterium]